VIESYGSVTSLASAIDRSEGAIRKWLRAQAEPNATDLRLISTATGISVEWLIFGGVSLSTSLIVDYLAYLVHRRDCQAIKKRPVVWTKLTAAQQEGLKERARAELMAWASSTGAVQVMDVPR
jgi:transcriptional regulator with XRE-family HTH domain